jgi:cytochrome c553
MTMINTPMFFAVVPRTFLDKMLALKPDPTTGKPDPEKFKVFAGSHPDNQAQAKFLADHNPPASYTNASYDGIHTFKFINRDNKTTLVCWRFVPQDGEQPLSDAELTSMPTNFLEQVLINRTMQGPVRCAMCHGPDGSGNTAMGKSLGIPNLHSAEVQQQTDARLAEVLANGTSRMPTFKNSLSREDIDTLVAHVRQLAQQH